MWLGEVVRVSTVVVFARLATKVATTIAINFDGGASENPGVITLDIFALGDRVLGSMQLVKGGLSEGLHYVTLYAGQTLGTSTFEGSTGAAAVGQTGSWLAETHFG